MPFDPGAIAPSNGLEEKDATLAVSLRLRNLLRQDDVNAILTRSDDRPLSVQERTDTANNNGAVVFVSVHFNSFTDGGPSGSLVLYPKDSDLSFAHTMSDAMGAYLGPLGVPDNGVQLRDNWWIHTLMPTVAVEPAFLSNTREASLIGTPGFQEVLAMSIRAGLEPVACRPSGDVRDAGGGARCSAGVVRLARHGDPRCTAGGDACRRGSLAAHHLAHGARDGENGWHRCGSPAHTPRRQATTAPRCGAASDDCAHGTIRACTPRLRRAVLIAAPPRGRVSPDPC